MTEQLPSSVPILVIGAGVHGLSTAWHAAEHGERVLVVDKTGVAAGASGIACGVVRNNYFQPAMCDLMAACVEVWESDPEAFHYHGSGYIALGPPSQESDLTEVFERFAHANVLQRDMYPSSTKFEGEIVAMTAAGRAATVCQEMDAQGCLGKPFEVDNLVAAVDKLIHLTH
jgi:glycine/D-amino acid oxidase-like deaminating enzyme